MASAKAWTAKIHTILRTTISQYDVNQAVTRGVERQQVQPGSVTCIQRFGGAINLHVHFHGVFLEGVSLDRTEAGLTPRFVKVEPPSDADVPAGLQQISRRVIRTRRRLGYLEAGIDAALATGYDPLLDSEPARARTLAAFVTQRIACGERAGQQVRRMGSGCGYEGASPALTGPRYASVGGFSLHANTQVPAPRRDQLERLMRYTARGAVALERLGEEAHGDLMYTFTRPWSDGTTGITLAPLELVAKLAALGPLPRVPLVRDAGCVAPHSQLRGAMIPTPRQQGVDGREASARTPRWSRARLLKRVFDLELSPCPLCRRGALRIIAAITHAAVSTRLLRHLKRAAVPPPSAPARARQETFDWVA